jgi:hypothetical protein
MPGSCGLQRGPLPSPPVTAAQRTATGDLGEGLEIACRSGCLSGTGPMDGNGDAPPMANSVGVGDAVMAAGDLLALRSAGRVALPVAEPEFHRLARSGLAA